MFLSNTLCPGNCLLWSFSTLDRKVVIQWRILSKNKHFMHKHEHVEVLCASFSLFSRNFPNLIPLWFEKFLPTVAWYFAFLTSKPVEQLFCELLGHGSDYLHFSIKNEVLSLPWKAKFAQMTWLGLGVPNACLIGDILPELCLDGEQEAGKHSYPL